MCRILIFGGTTEGRLLAEYCMQQEIAVCVSVVSGYGADLLPVGWRRKRWKNS